MEPQKPKTIADLEKQATQEKHPKKRPLSTGQRMRSATEIKDIGTISLCCINLVVYVLDHVMKLMWVKALYFFSNDPQWWQFFTSAFCHFDWTHLSNNLFSLYVFGKLVEEQEGAFGVWASYLVCALGANLAMFWFNPSSIGIGASGAVFGLFAVSVLVRISWNAKKLLEVGILGQYVVQQVVNEFQMQLKGGVVTSSGSAVGHLAHLGGALMGVVMILLLNQIPDPNKNKN